MKKSILTAYYSKSGHTEHIAKEIATLCGADIEPIKCAPHGDQGFGFIRALFKTGAQKSSPIQASTKEPSDYDIVVIGTPVWMFKLSSFVRAYLKRHAKQFQQVAFFCTEGGSGDKKVYQQMSDEIGMQPIATVTITEQEIKEQTYQAKLTAFADKLAPKQAVA